LGFVALARVNPKTQTISHFFPKLYAALQKKSLEPMLRVAPAPAVFSI
jgi:hypothetical protein